MKIKQQKQIKAFLIEEFGNKKGCAVSDRQEKMLDTLIQNTAQLPIPLDEEDILHPGFPGGNGGGQARRASADDGKLHPLHACTSFVSPVSRRLPPPDLVSCV